MENESNNTQESLNVQPPNDPAQQFNKVPERGGCLTAFLIFMIIANAAAILLYLGMGEKIARASHLPSYTPAIMSLFGVLNLVFAIMIYKWKKAGVIGIVINSAVILILNLALGMGVRSFGGVVGVVILVILVNPVWKHFK